MGELEKLRKRQEEIVARLTELHEEIGDSKPTDEQQAEWDELDSESRENAERIKPLEEREARERRVAESRARWGSVQTGAIKENPFDGDVRSMDSREVISRARRVLDGEGDLREHVEHLRDEQRAKVEKVLRTRTGDLQGDQVARLLISTESEHYRSAFQKLTAGAVALLTSEEARSVEQVRSVQRAMSVGTDASGGYAVPVLIDPTIIYTGQGSSNPVRRLARVETITTSTWRGLTSAGMSWSFKAEGAEATDDSPTIGQPVVGTHRADGFIPFSIEVNMDWPSFASVMAEMLDRGYDELLAQKLVVGTGTGEPKGLITALAALGAGNVMETATAGAIAPGDVYALWARLPERHRDKSTTAFLSSVSVENAIRQLGETDPNFTVTIRENRVRELFGKEYANTDYMSAMPSGTTPGNLLALGDMKGFLIAQRAGMNVEFIPHLVGSNLRPTGQRGWFAWARVGSDIVDNTAFQLLQNKTV